MGGGVYGTYKRNVDIQASEIRKNMSSCSSKPMGKEVYNEFIAKINNMDKFKSYGVIETTKNKLHK